MDLLERWIYNAPTPSQRTRDRPMKALALGMSRLWMMLGRQQWSLAGTANGNPSITRGAFGALFDHCEAITDQPGTLFAPALIAAYPEAKVILNRRDVDT
ncbi:hypothetical protein BBP40_009537 [Aspergillus hancockii]|nr:hypothetical protein BBP40_009537 [Aspergillus hancockii]